MAPDPAASPRRRRMAGRGPRGLANGGGAWPGEGQEKEHRNHPSKAQTSQRHPRCLAASSVTPPPPQEPGLGECREPKHLGLRPELDPNPLTPIRPCIRPCPGSDSRVLV